MLALFVYSLAALAVVLLLSHKLPRWQRLALALLTLIVLNGPGLLYSLLQSA